MKKETTWLVKNYITVEEFKKWTERRKVLNKLDRKLRKIKK